MAIVSLVCAIAGFITMPFILSILAIVFGKMQLNRIEEDPQKYGGRQLAQIGFWIGVIRGGILAVSLVLSMIILILIFILPLFLILIAGSS